MNPRDVPTLPDDGGDADQPSRLGHFEIVGSLGAGGMGMVYEGRDTVLDRRVALKLLHPSRAAGHVAPARLLREAQALAKLSHPNVVTVFEVGMADDDPFVAMELVEGKTLLAWISQQRTWREVLDVFIAVGHGLAAVHALGLVHRDFKPSNVLIDLRGVPKLGDFGLVTTVDEPATGAASMDTTSMQTLTQAGSVLGTPAYMAPEQRLGACVDQRADQYSFAKSLLEALPDAAPAALQPILSRALADEPGDRYPAMEPLLDALARVRRGNRARWIAAGSTVAVIAAVAVAWGFGRAQSAVEPCPRPTDRLAKVWSPARRVALESHLTAIDPALGAQRFTAAAGVLDRGGERWLDQRVDACQAARASRQSGELLDRRMSCLDRALLEIDETAAVLERAIDRATLDNAMRAAIGLPALDDCADVTALLELLPRPTNPVQRSEADALARESVAIDVALRTGGIKRTNVSERAQAAVARARKLGDPETLARALRSLAGIQRELEAGAPLDDTLREAIMQASAAHDDRLVSELWSSLLSTLATQRKVDEARTVLPAAEAALARTRSTTELYVKFLDSKALALTIGGDMPGSLATLATAAKMLDAAGAASPSSPAHSLAITIKARVATTQSAAGHFEEAARGLREVIPLANAEYGADHPAVMQIHFNLGVTLRRMGDNTAALAEFREAARIGEARLVASPSLAELIFAVGSTQVALGKQEEAIPALQRAVDMDRSTLPPGDPRLADSLSPLAAAYIDTEHYDEGKKVLDEVISILEKRGIDPDEKLAIAYSNRGEWAGQTSHCDQGWPDFDHALAIYQDLKLTSDVYDTLTMRAECQLDTSQWGAAVTTTERLLAARDASPEQHVQALFDHGKALWNLGRRAEGIAEVRAARATMKKDQIGSGGAEPATKWLVARGLD
jgi:serine/threonine protein kinase/tetratricopeptide (TPR) repeat protein